MSWKECMPLSLRRLPKVNIPFENQIRLLKEMQGCSRGGRREDDVYRGANICSAVSSGPLSMDRNEVTWSS